MEIASPTMHIPFTIQEGDLYEGALEILKEIRPSWNRENVEFKLFTDGITNKLVGCKNSSESEEMILVRVYGQKTDLLIDRAAETRNMKVMHEAGYAPCLYATFENGLAYEYVPGVVLNKDTVKSPNVYPLVARMMAQMHSLDLKKSSFEMNGVRENNHHYDHNEPFLWKKGEAFLELVPVTFEDAEKQARYRKLIPSKKELKNEWMMLKKELEGIESPVVFCHNDLLLGNVIYKNKRVTFIDYEYAAYNYQAFDIGNHFNEYAGVDEVDYSNYPPRDYQLAWLRVYLEAYKEASFYNKNKFGENCVKEGVKVSEKELNKLYVQVNKFSLASNLFWGIWALIQAEHSTIDFDFLGYAALRLNEYFSTKMEFLNLHPSVP